ncbi:MAG: SDR family NAD(P)-dependent oxidoreductase, partial [Alphaproteobacteria bacterium]|nr:SDR family NAD(P)-dependent oxidoreductase [Alphaproteobacteria bacterium]
AAACVGRGAEADARTLDVTDRATMADWIAMTDEVAPLDLVIANAGVSIGDGGPMGIDERVRGIFAVNVEGVFNTVNPALVRMAARRSGQIAIMSSIAAYRGLPGAIAYCASKAAVKAYGEGLRAAYAARGVRVSVICPGFVRSRMTARNRYPMPFLMDANRAAEIVRRGLAANRGRIAFPWPLRLAGRLIIALPDGLVDAVFRRFPAKE